MLLTLLDIPEDFHQINYLFGNIVPLPWRLKKKDFFILSLGYISGYVPGRDIFRDFLGSVHPLALDGLRYATAALACLKITFKRYHYEVPLSHLKWSSQHYRHPGVTQKHLSHQRHTGHPAGKGWNKFFFPITSTSSHIDKRIRQSIWVSDSHLNHFPNLAQHLRTCVSNQIPQGILEGYSGIGKPIHSDFDFHFREVNYCQKLRSKHLQLLLHKSAYSNDLLNFARQRVFRFGYLQRSHPTYIKKAIFALAKYVHRVTGETVELRACESIWGRAKWFTAQ